MPRWKRALDLGLAALTILGAALPMLAILPAALALQGRPILYRAPRVGRDGRPFVLLKLRTMTQDAGDAGVTGGDKAARITPFGAWLRRSRADEIPQVWNVIRGEMSFVGPRPPLASYVEAYPELYAEVLRLTPGITGLATVMTATHENRLLARARTGAETDRIYRSVCVPRKARLDGIYAAHLSARLDLWILGRTLRRSARDPARPRAKRLMR